MKFSVAGFPRIGAHRELGVDDTAVYFAMKKWFNTSYHYMVPELDDAMDADVITFEASRSKLTILDSLQANRFETEVGPGVYDIHSPRVPGTEEIEAALRLMLDKIPKENLWVNPDCGLKTRGEPETAASLTNLVAAAKSIRKTL